MKSETEIQKEILHYLADKKIFAFRLSNTPSNKYKSRSDKFTPSGLPDILCIYKSMLIGFEVKSENGKIRIEQRECAQIFEKNGAIYIFVRSLNEVIEILNKYI